jgi:hypothetical protein
MASLVQQRCRNHSLREAVARCPDCRHYFCRECVSEHDDQVLCAVCLQRRAKVPLLQRRGFAAALSLLFCLIGFLTAWIFFFVLGESLLSLPDAFHEGTFWHLKDF